MSVYNHLAKLLLNQEVDLGNVKAMLLDGNAAFDATHTDIDQVSNSGAWEVYGNGWAQGGPALTNVSTSIVSTDDAVLTADDVSVTATGGPIGPADAVVFYDASSGKPLAFYAFGGSETAGETTPFKLRILSGLFALVS